MGVSVAQILRQAALRAPDQIGVSDFGSKGDARRDHTYGELDLAARRVAAALGERGVQPGDRVALLAESSADFVAAWFGILYAGAAVVPIAVMSASPEIQHRLQHAGVSVFVHDQPRAALAREASEACIASVQLTTLTALTHATTQPLARHVDVGPEGIAMVLYTSGTTGKAKGAAISHASLLVHTTVLVARTLQLDASDTVLCALPLTHSFGCRMAMLVPIFAQARIVMVSRFDAERTLELACDERVTWLPAVPTMFAAWSHVQTTRKPHALKWALSAGAPLPDEIARRAEARLGATVRQGYGMTEATFATIDAPPDERVLGSVGKPVWGVEVRVIDEHGRDVRCGEVGEVIVRGHNVMSHYLFDPEATLEAAKDGFMHSGDIGRLDAQGRLTLVDRLKDLVIRGGFNVYPSEVEDVLSTHPGVAQVAVIGRPDAFYGEEIVAVIVRVAGASVSVAQLAQLADANLSRTKAPREYVFVEALPLGASGKVQKRVLRDMLTAGELTLQRVSEAKNQGASHG